MLIFPTDDLRSEFPQLPLPVQKLVNAISDTSNFDWVVTSIKSDYTGDMRTSSNGPNHIDGIAIDIVPRFDFDKMKTEDKMIPNYNRLPLLWKSGLLAYKSAGEPLVRMVFESDHIHIDTNLTGQLPGVFYYTINRHRETNDDPICKFNKTEIKSVIPVLRLMNLI